MKAIKVMRIDILRGYFENFLVNIAYTLRTK